MLSFRFVLPKGSGMLLITRVPSYRWPNCLIVWSRRCRSDSSISAAAPALLCSNAMWGSKLTLIPFASKAMLPICYLLSHSHCYLVGRFNDFPRSLFIRWFLGNIRRFRRICEHIQAQVCSKRYPSTMSSPPSQKPIIMQPISQQQTSQPMSTSSNSAAASAESISCESADSSDRLSYRERQNETESEVETFFDCNTTIVKPRRSSASSNKNSEDGGSSCTAIKSVSSR